MDTAVPEQRAKYERLRYVTENFQALQGLTWVCLGGWFAVCDIEQVPGFGHPRWFAWLVVPLEFALIALAIRYIPRYYERRFGSVNSRVGAINTKVTVLLLVFVLLFAFWPVLPRYADLLLAESNNLAHRVISDPEHRTNLEPLLFCFALMCAAASNESQFGRLRNVSFFACLLLLWGGILVFLPLRNPGVTLKTAWKVVNAGWFGISFMLLGLYNHLTLLHLLPAKGQTSDNE